MSSNPIIISTTTALESALASPHSSLDNVTLASLDLTPYADALLRVPCSSSTMLLGCIVPVPLLAHMLSRHAVSIPPFSSKLPFSPFRAGLYTVSEMYSGFDSGDYLDSRIYQHYVQPATLATTLARCIHDFHIDLALARFKADLGSKPVVALMGGHDNARGSHEYLQAVRLGYALTRGGFCVGTGGGPGNMEAANLGAYLANEDWADVLKVVDQLKAKAPLFTDADWLASALHIDLRPKRPGLSLGVPTYFYGHEPSNAFASFHAKYFDNALREDALLKLANGGVVYFAGKAGTIQEVFQDACLQYYSDRPAPMILVGKEFWTQTLPVWPLLQRLSQGKVMAEWLRVLDDEEEAVLVLETFSHGNKLSRDGKRIKLAGE